MTDLTCALCGEPAPRERYTIPPRRERGLVLRFCTLAHLAEWEDADAECKDKEPERVGVGRPRINLDLRMIEAAENLFELGHAVTTVAQAMGVGRETAYRWLREGEAAHKAGDSSDLGTSLALYWDAYIRGRVSTKKKVIKNIIDASDKDWRAGVWYLSVTEPEDYNEKVVTARALHELGVSTQDGDDPPIGPDEIQPKRDAPPPIVKGH